MGISIGKKSRFPVFARFDLRERQRAFHDDYPRACRGRAPAVKHLLLKAFNVNFQPMNFRRSAGIKNCRQGDTGNRGFANIKSTLPVLRGNGGVCGRDSCVGNFKEAQHSWASSDSRLNDGVAGPLLP